ncbi:MAG: type II toxin-antitoxin system VapC family toxin [Terricaulis sp.]
MSLYVDANILVALFTGDALSERASSLVAAQSDTFIVSDVAALEFSSAVARMVRAKVLSPKSAKDTYSDFDLWVGAAESAQIAATDIEAATAIVRRFDINLHGADAIHVAIAMRMSAGLLTLDNKMRSNARKLGLVVI